MVCARIPEVSAFGQGSGAAERRVTARHFDAIYPNLRLKQPIISSWLKEEEKWRARWADAEAASQSGQAKRLTQTENPEVTQALELWTAKAMGDSLQLSGQVLREKWVRFADLFGIPEDQRINLSEGWLSSFKKRCGLREFKRHSEAASANINDVKDERAWIREFIDRTKFELKDIFNMDETGLFYGMPPDRGLMTTKMAGVKDKKTRITYAFTANADGTEKLDPFVIGKSKQPRAFDKKSSESLGFLYRNNAKAWMTAVLYQEWLCNWGSDLRDEKRHVLLLQDNFSAHIVPDDITNITVENVRANLTAHVQPNDAGIIRCFKAHYRSKFFKRAINCYDQGITPAKIYAINQLEAMRLADMAWDEVSQSTIANCWLKAGILPPSLTQSRAPPPATLAAPEAPVENEVDACLDHLESRGALHRKNRMAIDELINPESENELVGLLVSDEEIVTAVQEYVTEAENKANDGADTTDVDKLDETSKPSRREALVAADTLKKYLQHIDDPFAREMEKLLAGFGWRTRLEATNEMVATQITDYFS
ncbi:hypothetical protein ONZ45_g9701 [Pleurotus djamor]|nr:hypothetical protein ONZ45_g9701 [Pleurotus djamor]